MEPFPAPRALKDRTPAPRGFTLVEMVVVLAIIVVITGIVITGQSGYNQSLVLTDTAYTVAFSVREAQSLGLGSRSAGGVTNAGYGVRFTRSDSYTIFADTAGPTSLDEAWCPRGTGIEARPGNCRYNPAVDTVVETYSFDRGFTISRICGKLGDGVTSCTLTGLDVVFMRPETKAILTGTDGRSFTCAEIHVTAPTGNATRVVRISQLGEISVGQTCS